MQVMQGDLRRAIETQVDNAGAGTGRGVTLQVMMGPCAGTEGAWTSGIAHHRYATRQAHLAAMGMTTQHEIETGMRRMLVYLG